MRPVIFAGPSAYGIETGQFPHIDFLPPARCGDVLRQVRLGRKTIGIVDGVFENEPAIKHSEIIYALSERRWVYGAASMGALRAAECSSFGMIGVGKTYEEYQSGKRFKDSDVALCHAPSELGYMPLTLPLVDAEHAITTLAQLGQLTESERELLWSAANQLFYKDRTWTAVFQITKISTKRAKQIGTAVINLGALRKTQDFMILAQRIHKTKTNDHSKERTPFTKTTFFSDLWDATNDDL